MHFDCKNSPLNNQPCISAIFSETKSFPFFAVLIVVIIIKITWHVELGKEIPLYTRTATES